MSDAAFYAIPDQIDLRRLVRRLEIGCLEEEWNKTPNLGKWIKAQGALQRIAHARTLLKNVEELDSERLPPRAQQLEEFKQKLDEVEEYVKEVKEQSTPKPTRPRSILSEIRRPPLPSAAASAALTLDLPPNGEHVDAPSNAQKAAPLEPPTDELLLPADSASFPTSNSFAFPTPMPLLPPSITIPSSATATTGVSDATATATGVSTKFSQNTNALHQDLSNQLAQMATQLRKNAQYFSEALVKDKAVMEDTEVKLESNFNVMEKEQKRLKEHSGKSSSTTWLTYGIILAVIVLFMFMVLLIRATRW